MKFAGNRDDAALPDRLANALSAEPRILAAYVHGSFGSPRFRKDSDVDCALLLLPGHSLSAKERMHLEAELGALLGVTLDIGLLTSDNLIYFVHAVHHGTCILSKNQAMTDELVGRAYSLYARLKEDRREVEAAYHAA